MKEAIDREFKWIPLYEGIASKLLAYKDRRDELVKYIKTLAEESNVTYIKENLDDIDPFTVMGMFNRGGIEKRKFIARKLTDFLGFLHPVPEHFGNGVPRLNTRNSWFFDHKAKRGADDIDSLWDFLEIALSFAKNNNQNEEIKQKFIQIYDKVIKQRWIGQSKITMGLYWIRPQHYLTLDERSRTYLTEQLEFSSFGSKVISAIKYLALIDELKEKFQDEDYPVNSFPELSLSAYEYKPSSAPDPSPHPSDPSPQSHVKEELGKYGNEPYEVGSIVDDGCFIAEAELENILGRLQSKRNIILQGPPGTGKTWLAKRLAYALIGVKDKDKLKAIQFHSNISYEDFVIGYRPSSDGTLDLKSGPFLEMIRKAREDYTNDYVVVIEEINRGNPARVFGEMLTLLEADKREEGEALQLSYGDEEVFVPPNLFVIGTMNVADRSLALVDFALRRRFAFINLQPNFEDKWKNWVHKQTDIPRKFLEKIGQRIRELNDTITDTPSLGEQYKIGHSYFTPDGNTIKVDYRGDYRAWYEQVVKTEIEPLLREYWSDSTDIAKKEAEKLSDGI